MPPLDPTKHALPRLTRSTLNELQQNQHEKASLVCVRVQSPSGLALVPCALSMVDLSGQFRCWITHTITQTQNHTKTQSHKHTITQTHTKTSLIQKNVLFFIFGTLCSYDPLWRGFFFLGNQGKKGSLRSRASLLYIVYIYLWCGVYRVGYREGWINLRNFSRALGIFYRT